MKSNSIKFLGLTLVCVGVILGAALLPQLQPKANAATTFSPMVGYQVWSGNGSIYGTNYNGLYPTSIAGSGALQNVVYLGSGRTGSIQVQGQSVSGTATMVVGIYQRVAPTVLNMSGGSTSADATTPLQLVGTLTNACTTTLSQSTFNIVPGSGGTFVGAGQSWYVGAITNWGSGVLTNYAISASFVQ